MTNNVELGSIAEIIMGQSPRVEDVNECGDGFPLLNGPTEFSYKSPIPVQFTTNGKKFSKTDDILFCVRGSTTGRMNYADQVYAIGRGLAAIRGKNGYPTPYIKAIIEQNLSRLLLAATGSTFPNVGKDLINSFSVEVVGVALARKISEFIVSIDNKITLNHQINQTLEAMAQALFKSWFVDFEPVKAKMAVLSSGGNDDDANLAAMSAISGKSAQALLAMQTNHPEQYQQLYATAELFPSEMVDSELGEIPKGWEVKALDQIADYKNGLALQKFRPENEDDFLPVVKIAQLKKGYADGEEKASPNIKSEFIIDNGDVVFSWSGSLMVDIWCGGKAALNQHLFKVTSKTYPKWFFYQYTNHHLEAFQRIAQAKAVTMGHIKREHLEQAFCAVPCKVLLDIATQNFEPMLNKAIECRLESNTLIVLRDALLPKLLSGELSVDGVGDE